MKIYIVRHGETRLNALGVMQGRLDEPLNQSGRDLAAISGRNMRDIHFDACISSPLIRAYETAEIILRESGNDIPIETDERIQEMFFGDIEGHTLSVMGEEGKLFVTDTFHFKGFPGGENIRDVCARTQDFLRGLAARDDGKNYLIATHGCALRAMLNFLYDDPSDFWHGHVPYNCCVNIVEAHGGDIRLITDDKIYYPADMVVDRYK